jgi:hypothetical protein
LGEAGAREAPVGHGLGGVEGDGAFEGRGGLIGVFGFEERFAQFVVEARVGLVDESAAG